MRYLIFISFWVPVLAMGAFAYASEGDSAVIVTQADKIEWLVKLVGGLVTTLGVMVGILIKVVWSAHNQNKKDHKTLKTDADNDSERQWENITQIAHDLNQLLGQHDVAFSLKGCAWEPENLKAAMLSVFTELASQNPNPLAALALTEKEVREAVRLSLMEMLGEASAFGHEQRKGDKPPYLQKGEMPEGQTGGD